MAQDRCHVELFHRVPEGGHWIFTETAEEAGGVELESIGVSLQLRQLYHKVEQLGWVRRAE